MIEQSITVGDLDWQQELRPESILWISSDDHWGHLEADEECIAVIDMDQVVIEAVLLALTDHRHHRCTVIGFGRAAGLDAAQIAMEPFDIAFLTRPEHLADDDAPRFVYDQLAAVYEPFRRIESEFVANAAEGEQALYPEPMVAEIDAAYQYPPFAFNEIQHKEMVALANRHTTEVRAEEE